MGQKKRQRTAEHHLSDLDRQALSLAEDDIYDHNFKRLLQDGTIVEEDLLDWDAYIKTPPPAKRAGVIRAIFKYIGRSKPVSTEDPLE